jgi:hypothetical protein
MVAAGQQRDDVGSSIVTRAGIVGTRVAEADRQQVGDRPRSRAEQP